MAAWLQGGEWTGTPLPRGSDVDGDAGAGGVLQAPVCPSSRVLPCTARAPDTGSRNLRPQNRPGQAVRTTSALEGLWGGVVGALGPAPP